MVKNRGEIKNQKKMMIANFFGYDSEDEDKLININ